MRDLFKINTVESWVLCCFFNFLIASIMGLLMRFVTLFHFSSINYSFLLHAHSHVAMLGWVYMTIYVLIVYLFIPKDNPKDKRCKPIYNQLFWITELTVIGMMISFPLQGYAFFSIVFSTTHILLSYVFCILVWKDTYKEKTPESKLLSAAILFMVFSTFGVWCLGPALSMLGQQNAFYQIAIQFFLHFQFNGWFLFAVLALFLKQAKRNLKEEMFNKFFVLLILSTFLTMALPVSWYVKNEMLKWINIFGVLLQILAFVYFYKMVKPHLSYFKSNLNTTTKYIYGLVLFSLVLKIGIQLLNLMPDLAEVSHQIRNFVIGFIHLTALGIITGILFGVLIENKILDNKYKILRYGIKTFILGYSMNELLLFVQGGLFYLGWGKLFGYFEGIFIAGVLIVVSIMLIMISILNKKQESIY
ncbi:hypothetical protein [[Flexibacter] sp. ATCC 35103]|uniref:hypothetical protein n=1 Tax=[Flexibacter] sp. ATCC 35103 TaxID=1937528 RepID=UPI0009C9EF7B|nr:hypothetical protein [[Flexibacter] sp. ATCC 35103]OMQ13587.1 hypothetical protein BXU01_03685 [[Flexibacter] sp. ATCC 35103]